MQQIIAQAKQSLLSAQQRQKAYHDRKARAKQVEVGSEVLLSTKNIAFKNPGTAKLLPKYVGPFKVLDMIGTVAYRLLLPETMKLHNVFHLHLQHCSWMVMSNMTLTQCWQSDSPVGAEGNSLSSGWAMGLSITLGNLRAI